VISKVLFQLRARGGILMRRNKLSLFLHLVWATWDRLPLITADIRYRLYRQIESEARKQGCTVLAIGGVEDHLHMLISLPATMAVADLVKQLKGVSSHFVNQALQPDAQFKWQGSYGAFTVSRWDNAKLIDYINGQQEHHASDTLILEYEQTFDEAVPD
jgi:REP element-mobilizing transposase RayT